MVPVFWGLKISVLAFAKTLKKHAGGKSGVAVLKEIAAVSEQLVEPDDLYGEEAERIGLVSLCVPKEEVHQKALEVAVNLAKGAQAAIRFTKHALNNWMRSAGPAFDASLALELLGFTGPEVKEGLASHREKRKPVFTAPKR